MSRIAPVLLLTALTVGACSRQPPPEAAILAGSVGQMVCAGEFLSGRDLAALRKQEFSGWPASAIIRLVNIKIDRAKGIVTTRAPLGARAVTVMRPGLGCVPAGGLPPETLAGLRADGPAGPPPDPKALWPQGERVATTPAIEGVDRAKLDKAIDVAFGKCPAGNDPFTRALLVVHGGRIVAERYGKGFGPDQRIYGASMSKSVASTLLGLRIAEGKMGLDDVALPAAAGRPDPITNRHLVTMTAGLKFGEDYDAASDVNKMLFTKPDMAGFAAAMPAVSKPGAVWQYSSGSTNILMASLRKSFKGDDQAYWNYPRKALFDPLGMRTAMFQTDASGTLVGSSYMWASPRDWARLGLLYLQDGRWEGRQLLPKSWVDFVRTPTPATAGLKGDDHLTYGGGFWLDEATSVSPAPVYAMGGWAFQVVRMVPARDLVVVRMGHTLKDCSTSSIKPIIELFPKRVSPAPPPAGI